MSTKCLPFQQIPHTTRLFLDYLSYTPSVHYFFSRSPMFSEWVRDESKRVVYDATRRSKVSGILNGRIELGERPRRRWPISSGSSGER